MPLMQLAILLHFDFQSQISSTEIGVTKNLIPGFQSCLIVSKLQSLQCKHKPDNTILIIHKFVHTVCLIA